MAEAVEDRLGDRGIAYDLVPSAHGDLAGALVSVSPYLGLQGNLISVKEPWGFGKPNSLVVTGFGGFHKYMRHIA